MLGAMGRGAAWMLLFRLMDRLIGIISISLLARLLVPNDFGLVAMAMSVIAIIELATAFSFDISLIQKQDPRREHFDTVWTLNILIALAGATLTASLAYPAAAFYDDPRLAPVMFAIGGAWLVSGFENPGTVHFRREMRFAAEFRLLASKRLISFAVTLAAALAFRSYWALVIGMATGRIAGVALSYAMHPFRPRLSLACARELISFSSWMLANNLAGVLLGRIPHFYVGRLIGAQALGIYNVASELSQFAHGELVAPINRAMFPGYARLVGEPEKFRRVCIDVTSMVVLVVLPVSAGMAVLAQPVVRILLGPQWLDAIPVLQILAIAGIVSALNANCTSAYLALGKPHLVTGLLAVRVLLLVVALALLGDTKLVTSIAWAELAAALGSFGFNLHVMFKTLRFRPADYAAALWRPFIATVLSSLLTLHLLGSSGGGESFGDAVLGLVIGATVGGLSYVVGLWALWRLAGQPYSVEKMLVDRVLGSISGRWIRSAP